MAFDILSYKHDQGRPARNVTFYTLAVLSWYGASSLHAFFGRFDWSLTSLGFSIPVVHIAVSPGFLIATLFFVAGLYGARFAVNHPKSADLLIDTEGEMRRVTWPSWPETLNGSIVVIITVVALLLVLAGADMVLSRFFEHVVF